MTLREYRLAAGLTQAQVAEAIGCTKGYYANVEGRMKPLSMKYYGRMRERLGWQPTDVRVPVVGRAARNAKYEQQTDVLSKANTKQLGAEPCQSPLRYADKAWTLYLLGLAVYDGEVPHDWRQAARHKDLARSAIYAMVDQLSRKGVRIDDYGAVRERGSVA